MLEHLTMVVHGESGVGKSTLADTMPGPRVIFDIEGGTRWTPSVKVSWNPKADPPPVPDGTWDTALVTVQDVGMLDAGFQWLNSGKHPFLSCGIDSLTELQKRVIDDIVGTDQMQMQDWGKLLRKVESKVRQIRDIAARPENPLETVVIVCATAEKGKEVTIMRPGLQGQLGLSVPYFCDVVGYMTQAIEPDGLVHSKISFVPVGGAVAKDRTRKLGNGRLDPTIVGIRETIFGGGA